MGDHFLRVRLLANGQECAEAYGGDMAKWAEAQRGGTSVTYDYSVSVTAREKGYIKTTTVDRFPVPTAFSTAGREYVREWDG